MKKASFMLSLFVLGAASALAATAATTPEAVTFKAADGVTVHAEHYASGDLQKPLVLLFHQAGSNRGEYREISPRLHKLGFSSLALDQRSGAPRWGLENQTVAAAGSSSGYLEALPDLEAALAWSQQAGYQGPVLVWGSSYSAALVFLLAADHPDEVDGVLAFSPGEYLGRKGLVAEHAARVEVPVLILAPPDEEPAAQMILEAVGGSDKKLEVPPKAVHGSSMLIPARNPAAAEVWPRVEAFLARLTTKG